MKAKLLHYSLLATVLGFTLTTSNPVHAESSENEPGYIEARRCVFIESGYNSFTNEFTVLSTTPIEQFTITKSSGRTTQPIIKGNTATFQMDIKDYKNWHVEYTLVDHCDTWKSGMRTLT